LSLGRYYTANSKSIWLVLALIACLPLLFENAFQYSVPMGYAGLFTQMADQIAAENFALPISSPFYGPGGIPFAYPPLGLYLFSVFIKLTGKYYIYLIWMPPLFTLVSLIPLYYLSNELFKSPLAAAFTIIIAATSSDLYIAHAWSAGIVRAPAFIFTLLSIYFFHRQNNSPGRYNLLLTGLFFGLALLSHLAYGLFCFVWILCWSGLQPSVRRILDSTMSLAIGMLIAMIWVVPISLHYGSDIFLYAFNSHNSNNLSLLLAFNFSPLLRIFTDNTISISSTPILTALVFLGAFFLILRKEFTLLIFYMLVILFFPETDRFVFLIGSLLAGFGLFSIGEWLSRILQKGKMETANCLGFLLVIPVLAFIWYGGFDSLKKQTPKIEAATFELAEIVQAEMPKDAKYLALVKQDEAEWLPFMFQREPLVAQWGSEWLGEYNRQTHLMSLFHGCQQDQDWSCVEHAIGEAGTDPDFVVTYTSDERLNDQLSSLSQWDEVYSNKRYLLWARAD